MKLSKYLDAHKYPAILYALPLLVRLVHFLNYVTILRNWYVRSALRKLEKAQSREFRFLDAGCGMGDFAIGLGRRNSAARILGIDINPDNIELSRRIAKKMGLNNIDFAKDDLTNLNVNEKFDLVLCNSTLQFIENDDIALRNINSAMKKGGKLLLYVPIEFRRYLLPQYIEDKLLKDFFYRYHNDFLMHKYKADDVKNKLMRAGFEILSIKYTYGLSGALAFELYSLFLASMKMLPIVFFIPIGILYIILVFPVQLLLMVVDFLLPRKTGNGMLVVAVK